MEIFGWNFSANFYSSPEHTALSSAAQVTAAKTVHKSSSLKLTAETIKVARKKSVQGMPTFRRFCEALELRNDFSEVAPPFSRFVRGGGDFDFRCNHATTVIPTEAKRKRAKWRDLLHVILSEARAPVRRSRAVKDPDP